MSKGDQAAVAQLLIISGCHQVIFLPDGKYTEPEIEYFLISPEAKSLSLVLPRWEGADLALGADGSVTEACAVRAENNRAPGSGTRLQV